MSISTSGKIPPANEIEEYDGHQFAAAGDPKSLFDLSKEVSSVFVIAHPDNSGIIYVGFDDSVTDSNGIPLSAGAAIGIDLDSFNQQIYATADTVADDVRFFSVV